MVRQLSRLGYLEPHRTLFLLCDIQEKFRPAMKYFEPMVKNTNKLLNAGKALKIPLIATEQYPEKLGRLVKELDVSHACGVFPKTQFSMALPEIMSKINEMGKLESIVLFGLETHVCVEQTAADFVSHGFNVHVVADCCASRLIEDRNLAFDRLRKIGCYITTSETVIFKLLRDKNHPAFNEIRKLVSEPSADVGLLAKL